MKMALIVSLASQGFARDTIYEIAAGNMGLYGVAFFGAKAKKGDKEKLQRVWKKIIDLV